MYENVCYGRSFLKQVIARIDFASPIEKLEKGVPNSLIGTIVGSFPIVEPADVVMQEIAVNGSDIQSTQTASKEWHYFSKDRDRQLTLSARCVFVQYTNYVSFEETRRHFGAVVEALNSAFSGTVAARFGLRYINQIDLPVENPTLWGDFIAEDLLCSRSFFVEEESIARLITVGELKYGDVGLRFQFGMPNPDYPAAIRRPLFVLDLDGSVSQAHDLPASLTYMDEAHSRIQAIFERSITPALREKMNARPIQQ